MKQAGLLVLIVAVSLFAASSAVPPRIAFLRATAFAFDDEAISIVVQVEPNASNRAFILAAVDGDLEVRRSLIQLDGEDAKRTHWIKWGALPAGDLMLVALLLDQQGPVARVTRPIRIQGRWTP